MVSDIENDYVSRVHDDLAQITAAQWDGLLSRQAHPTPFMRHAYLQALQASGSAAADTGWTPLIITLWRGSTLAAACPLYLKTHSYGEYVFDWAWADAYERHGLAYYPKLLGAVPFTPVPGTRLLAESDAARAALAAAVQDFARRSRLSSAHILFGDENDLSALQAAGWMIRRGVQFHWQAPAQDGPPTFEDFLARLQREKRKKITQEMRRVRESGVSYTVHEGRQIDEPLWDFFHHCYTLTYRLHRSTPYLSRDFFARMAAAMPEHWLLFVARQAGEPVGCSLVAIDPGQRVAYGRYWGSVRHIPLLHFDACYYQPLAWCIAQGYRRFEGGAQGEHKMARGLLPVGTASAHWIADERFASAVEDFLAREGSHVEAYIDELNERNPFKATGLPDTPLG